MQQPQCSPKRTVKRTLLPAVKRTLLPAVKRTLLSEPIRPQNQNYNQNIQECPSYSFDQQRNNFGERCGSNDYCKPRPPWNNNALNNNSCNNRYGNNTCNNNGYSDNNLNNNSNSNNNNNNNNRYNNNNSNNVDNNVNNNSYNNSCSNGGFNDNNYNNNFSNNGSNNNDSGENNFNDCYSKSRCDNSGYSDNRSNNDSYNNSCNNNGFDNRGYNDNSMRNCNNNNSINNKSNNNPHYSNSHAPRFQFAHPPSTHTQISKGFQKTSKRKKGFKNDNVNWVPIGNNSTEEIYTCEACKQDFDTPYRLQNHESTHRECEEDGCNFSASAKAQQLHFVQVHQEGKFRIVLKTPEDIAKWREERKQNWPTAQNIEAKKRKLAQDKEDGIVVETKEFTYRERSIAKGRIGSGNLEARGLGGWRRERDRIYEENDKMINHHGEDKEKTEEKTKVGEHLDENKTSSDNVQINSDVDQVDVDLL